MATDPAQANLETRRLIRKWASLHAVRNAYASAAEPRLSLRATAANPGMPGHGKNYGAAKIIRRKCAVPDCFPVSGKRKLELGCIA